MNKHHIWLLFANNWNYKKRQWVWFIFELITPILLAIICAALQSKVPVKTFKKPHFFPTRYILPYKEQIMFYTPAPIIIKDYRYYTPKTPSTDELFRSILNMTHARITHEDSRCTRIEDDLVKGVSLLGCHTEADAISYSIDVKTNESTYVGSILYVLSGRDGPILPGATRLPKNLKVKFRPIVPRAFKTAEVYPKILPSFPTCQVSPLSPMREMVEFHQEVAKYWLEKRGENVDKSKWKLGYTCMPWPPYKRDAVKVIGYMPMITVFSFVLFAIRFTTILIREKASKIKEVLLMMGVQPSSYWTSWFATAQVYHVLPQFLLFTFILSLNVLNNTDPSLFFVVLCVYGFAYTTFCFMVSSFIQNENIGALLAFALFYFSVHVYRRMDEDTSRSTVLLSCLGFNCAMLAGLTNIATKADRYGTGMRWSNIHEPAVREKISLLECMGFLLLDAVLHALIAWYIDQVMPTSIGVSKHPLFFLKKHYWCPDDSRKVDGVPAITSTVEHDPRFFETAPNLKPGIQIRNLRKVFGSKAVVDGINLDMHEDQITVLLGHNGAGKTVTMSMLTGFLEPTSGTAIINGYDIRKDMVQVRKYVGVCPQFNIIYPFLTVMEHLVLFSRIKGQSEQNATRECLGLCNITGLQYKKRSYTSNLSGGQKRMLSVAISLVGGSKIVILDEPTAGMDVAIRRQTWDVLKKVKQGRTIMMTTHYMDEADALGDRIAIMSEGKIKCCGNSLFLKRLYGSGYHLILSTLPGCSAGAILEQIQTKIRHAKLERVAMNEISIELPETSAHKFPALFDQLERDKEQLKIGSFGIGTTSMEEVFIRSATSEPEGLKKVSASMSSVFTSGNAYNANRVSQSSTVDPVSNRTNNAGTRSTFDNNENALTAGDQVLQNEFERENDQLLHGLSYALHSLFALLKKRFLQSTRDVLLPLCVISAPIFLGFLVLSSDLDLFSELEPNLPLDVSMFDKVYLPYGVAQSKQPLLEEYAQTYAALFKDESHVTLEKFSISNQRPFSKTLMSKVNEFGLEKAMIEMPIGLAVLENSTRPSRIQYNMHVVAYYGTAAYHARSVSIIYALRLLLKQTLDDSFDIESSLHPINQISIDKSDMIHIFLAEGWTFKYAVNLIIVLAIVAVYAAHVVIDERKTGTKHIQVVSGAGPVVYWGSNFIYDLFIHLISLALVLPAFYDSGHDVWVAADGKLGHMIGIMLLYAVVIQWLFYSIGFFFDKPSSAILVVLVVNVLGSCFVLLVYYIARMWAHFSRGSTFYEKVDYVFPALLPGYNLMRIATIFKSNYDQRKVCNLVNCTDTPRHLCCPESCMSGAIMSGFCVKYEDHWPLVTSLLVQGIVLTAFVFLMEYHVFDRINYLLASSNSMPIYLLAPKEKEDEDVAAEKRRLLEKSLASLTGRGPDHDTVNVVKMFKNYGTYMAVNDLCMGIPKGECFGLLGQNGAGKTTTFKMMSGEVLLSGGNAYVMGYDVTRQTNHVQRNIGYCPQFDGLFLNLTAREALTLIARLRGFPTKAIPSLINRLTTILLFQDYGDIKAGLYSGGTKRKLNVAQTLVGRPPVLFLDEPSWGMDPEARRHLWNTLGRYRNEGTTLVLTSHSMEECEALCTRMGIMVNGRFMCLGSSQHLKSRFGSGYFFTIQLLVLEAQSEEPTYPVVNYVKANLPGSLVFDQHQNYIHFQAPDSCTLSGIFKFLEDLKGTLNVSDYSVQQTSLEQVFLSFARHQTPPIRFPSGCDCYCDCC